MAAKKPKFIGCTLKQLPEHLWENAAKVAAEINPANLPAALGFALQTGLVLTSQHIAVLSTKWRGSGGVNLTVSFPFDNPAADLRAKILSFMNLWGTRANVKFVETKGQGQIRIARTPGHGHYSYLGPDNLSIPANQPTMNFDSFTSRTPDSEFARVVCHEAG